MRKFFFLLSLSSSTLVFAQPEKWLEAAGKKLVSEKIYIHTDKEFYIAGETIYLKSYIMAGMYPSTFSSSFYLQLIDGDSTAVLKKVFPIISGTSAGTIMIPADLKEGRYFLAAFTNQSVKETEGFSCIVPLIIFNPSSKGKVDFTAYTPKPNIKIHYPNDKLVSGIDNRVYVNISDQYHQPLTTEVILLDEGNNKIKTALTNKAGVAGFNFIPQPNNKYRVEAEINGLKLNKTLLTPEAEGMTMDLSWQGNGYDVVINKTPGYTDKKINLLVEYEYNTIIKTEIKLKDNFFKLKLPAEKWPTGIIRIALLSEDFNSITQRFVFSNNDEGLVPIRQAGITDKNSNKSKLFTMGFAEDVEGTLSVQMSDANNSLDLPYKKENILNRMLFSAYLSSPLSFVQGLITDLKNVDVDLLNSILATQSLNKPGWNSIREAGKALKDIAEDTVYIRLEGIVKPLGEKTLPQGSTLNLIIRTKDSGQNVFNLDVEPNGHFVLNGLMFTDTASIIYNLNAKKLKYKEVELNLTQIPLYANFEPSWNFYRYFSPVSNKSGIDQQQALQKIYKAYSDTLEGEILSEVVVRTKAKTWREIKQESELRYVKGVFESPSTYTYNFISDPPSVGFISVIDFLRLNSRKRLTVQGQQVIATTTLMGAPIEYILYLDEVQTQFMVLQTLRLDDVAMIKIWANGFIGAAGNSPAIAVYTRQLQDKSLNSSSVVRVLTVPGYSPTDDFIVPGGTVPGNPEPSRYLSTIYWNSYLLIDNAGKKIETVFYNINKADKIRVIVQGMSSDGRIVYYDALHDVK